MDANRRKSESPRDSRPFAANSSCRALPLASHCGTASPRVIVYLEIVTAEQKTQLSEVIWVDPERMGGTRASKALAFRSNA
jgi:hypothetical protein